jgi:hypothetical protein
MRHNDIAAALWLSLLAGALCMGPIGARAEGNCPPGQTDTLKNYKGTCMDPSQIDPQTGRLKEASKCPPGQTDTLKHYKGTCMDPSQIDPQTGRLKEASKCPPGQTDTLKGYKGTCMPIEAGKKDNTANCPEGQIRHHGKCQTVGVLPGSTTGKKGGFIQMIPTCAAGTTYSESENKCVAQ